jgi:YHS domain-containing protein
MIRWILGFLATLLLIRLVLRFLLGLLQGLTEPSGSRTAGGPRSGGRRSEVGAVSLVRDPVCQTYIPREGAVTALVGGETRFYCSEACRAKDADSRRFNPPVGRAAHG